MRPLSLGDRQFLVELDARAWRRSRDWSGMTHAFEEKVSGDDVERALAIVRDHELPCVLHSGPYGDLSMSIYAHSDAPGVRPERLVSIGERHMPLRHAPTFANWNETFDAFARYTHTSRMREILEFYGLPMPAERSRYEY